MPHPATTRREVALAVWGSYLNTPYVWGGDDPIAGVDCSGLVLEGLKSVGLFPREDDASAENLLYRHFALRRDYPLLQDPELRRGCLVFWKRGPKIGHVEIVWTRVEGDVLTLGASGGGRRTRDRSDAIRQNAYVKIRRITPGWVAAIDPFRGQ